MQATLSAAVRPAGVQRTRVPAAALSWRELRALDTPNTFLEMPTIQYLTKIQFDHGALSLLPEELAALGVSRPLLVTDAGIVASGLLEQLLAVMPSPPAIFDETPANPTEAGVMAALAQ